MTWRIGRTQTSPEIAQEMVRLGGVVQGDIVYDLGCGEGNLVIAAAAMGARAVGVDNHPESLSIAIKKAAAAGVADRVRFLNADLHGIDFSDATVLTFYLVPSILEELKSKILTLPAGTRVVSHTHDMGDWTPDKVVKVKGRTLYYWVVGKSGVSPCAPVLLKTLTFLMSQPDMASRRIRELHLNNYFTVVELDNGSTGACMSDYRLNQNQTAHLRRALLENLCRDPLLLSTIAPFAAGGGVAGSIQSAVVSALSAHTIRGQGDAHFTCSDIFPRCFFDAADKVVIIGFGGLLDHIVDNTEATHVHVSDLRYSASREQFDASLNRYRCRRDVQITISDGADSLDRIREADLVAITGSTLGNGTLDGLLPACARCTRVVLQGQSAAVHPKVLFESGIHLIATTRKPGSVVAAASDLTGRSLRTFFEGGLPWIYLSPTK
jgi:hypothetical protein